MTLGRSELGHFVLAGSRYLYRRHNLQSAEPEDGAQGGFLGLGHLRFRDKQDRHEQKDPVSDDMGDRAAQRNSKLIHASAPFFGIPVGTDRRTRENRSEHLRQLV